VDPSVRDNFLSDLLLAQKTVSEGVCSSRARSTITHWDKWLDFCDNMGLHPFLEAFDDKISILQVFLRRVRIGELAASGDKIRARSAEDYVRSVAQTFLSMGSDDPRLNTAGKIDFRLQRMIAAWKRQDPPSKRVKPIPVQVLRRIAYIASQLDTSSETLKGTADMIFLAFFYLLRPGEYTDAPSDTVPFTFNDVTLAIGDLRLDLLTASDEQLLAASTGSLTFTKQKNGVENEVIRLGRSGDPIICPVKSLARRIIHLRNNNAPPHTPLGRVFTSKGIERITPSAISKCLKDAVRYIGFDLGFLPEEVSARSLRAAGATALLVAKVDPDIIQLLGRWRSDEMMRYLHLSASPVMKDFARKMLHADYTLAPNQLVPSL
jgi:hypothetical protein